MISACDCPRKRKTGQMGFNMHVVMHNVSLLCSVSCASRSKRADSQIHQTPNGEDANKETGNNGSAL